MRQSPDQQLSAASREVSRARFAAAYAQGIAMRAQLIAASAQVQFYSQQLMLERLICERRRKELEELRAVATAAQAGVAELGSRVQLSSRLMSAMDYSNGQQPAKRLRLMSCPEPEQQNCFSIIRNGRKLVEFKITESDSRLCFFTISRELGQKEWGALIRWLERAKSLILPSVLQSASDYFVFFFFGAAFAPVEYWERCNPQVRTLGELSVLSESQIRSALFPPYNQELLSAEASITELADRARRMFATIGVVVEYEILPSAGEIAQSSPSAALSAGPEPVEVQGLSPAAALQPIVPASESLAPGLGDLGADALPFLGGDVTAEFDVLGGEAEQPASSTVLSAGPEPVEVQGLSPAAALQPIVPAPESLAPGQGDLGADAPTHLSSSSASIWATPQLSWYSAPSAEEQEGLRFLNL